MSYLVKCQSCEKEFTAPDDKVKVDELLVEVETGKTIKCPHCQMKYGGGSLLRRVVVGKAGVNITSGTVHVGGDIVGGDSTRTTVQTTQVQVDIDEIIAQTKRRK